MNQLGLFEAAPTIPSNPYAFDPNKIGGAILPFIRFCRERLSAREGEISLSLIIEESWKRGRNHPYLMAWDAFNAQHDQTKGRSARST